MELRLLIGAHFTGQEDMRAQLEKNRRLLTEVGTLLPDREQASNALSTALKAIRKNKATDATGPDFLKDLTGGADCARVLMIDPDISGSMLRPHKNGLFYPRGNSTTNQLIRQLEGHATVRLYFATRNPATFLPACYQASLRFQPKVTYDQFNSASDVSELRWSEYIHRIQGKDAEVPVTVWSWEEYETNWRELAQAFSGARNKEDFIAAGEPMAPELSLQGAVRMQRFLQEKPADGPEQFDRIRDRFLGDFPVGEDPSLDDLWPETQVQGLTEAYDDDLYYIDRMENLTVIRPQTYT